MKSKKKTILLADNQRTEAVLSAMKEALDDWSRRPLLRLPDVLGVASSDVSKFLLRFCNQNMCKEQANKGEGTNKSYGKQICSPSHIEGERDEEHCHFKLHHRMIQYF